MQIVLRKMGSGNVFFFFFFFSSTTLYEFWLAQLFLSIVSSLASSVSSSSLPTFSGHSGNVLPQNNNGPFTSFLKTGANYRNNKTPEIFCLNPFLTSLIQQI
jgi:hypothetical protein